MLKESSQVSSKLVNFLYCQFVLVVNFTLNSRATSIPLTVCAITSTTADRLCNNTFYRWPFGQLTIYCTTINNNNSDFVRLVIVIGLS